MHARGETEAGRFLILTERLALRPREAVDAMVLNALVANPAIAPNLCTTIPEEGGEAIAIVDRRTGRLIGGGSHGVTGLGAGVEVTLWIGEPDWGRGYGTEAAHALIDHAFTTKGVEALWCSHRATNPRARRVIEKCGFQFRGSGMVRLPGRGAFPVERFALDRRTWVSLKAWGGVGEMGGTGDATRETAA